ncbi:hypothetical protein [Thiothrix winogradskyi]|uniref:Uncharacterized protein n=1 Tax=Thiothrix winogradskyi TaxID=96472 RepID=A0ABY3SZS6_9GAMM|nr:hypothetical protein [Thiothrix winogradskyi]UJS24477.1 hypothetical protein L2Y54_00175 [Thiothrix winogradskyi]
MQYALIVEDIPSTGNGLRAFFRKHLTALTRRCAVPVDKRGNSCKPPALTLPCWTSTYPTAAALTLVGQLFATLKLPLHTA